MKAVEMRNVTKRFPGVIANYEIDFDVETGEVHGLLGENGAGKTTLMNILSGLYAPDDGEISIKGKRVSIRSPQDAIGLGIGMVHQHFMLFPSLTVLENLVLGCEPGKVFTDYKVAEERIRKLSETYRIRVNPNAKVWQLSVGERQRVEIIKALFRGAGVLILDEPTAVLTPAEAKEFFSICREMVRKGNSVVFISHKLYEAMAFCDRITVLRDGKLVSTVRKDETNENELAKMMIGREVFFKMEKRDVQKGREMLRVEDLHALGDRGLPVLKGVSFTIHEGEMLGVAGVAGNGQRELAEVIYGLRKASKGRIAIDGRDLTNKSTKECKRAGLNFIPEDRADMGLVMDFDIAENLILGAQDQYPFTKGWRLNQPAIEEYSKGLISTFDIKAGNVHVKTKFLSGGNLQKVIVARELSRNPKLLIAAQPTRGLDVGSTEYIRHKLLEQREKGLAVLLISEDLDEVLMLSDKIAVMYEGEFVGVLDAEQVDLETIGLMMTGVKGGASQHVAA